MIACVRVCVCACVRACVYVCVCVRARACLPSELFFLAFFKFGILNSVRVSLSLFASLSLRPPPSPRPTRCPLSFSHSPLSFRP